jgi:beta-N-acetylglucosaminidase
LLQNCREVKIIKKIATKKSLLFAALFTILLMFNSSRILANEVNLIPRGYIDAPLNGSTIKGEMVVRGWFLDASGVSKIEVLVDGKVMGEAEYGTVRIDVFNSYPEYNNKNSGYQFTLSTLNLPNGQHAVTVRETGKNGAKKELASRLVNVQNSPARGYVDTPANGSTVKGDINVRGWFLDASGVSKIEVLVDGKRMGEAEYGLPRKDVYSAYPEYQNENSGYQFTLNTQQLTNGKHTIIVRETGENGGITNLSSRSVNVQNLLTRGYIDTPINGANVKGEIIVKGWFLDDAGVSKIEVLVDGRIMGEAQLGLPRPDVGNIYPEYQNKNSGYLFTLNTMNLTNGQHTMIVRETSNSGAIKDLSSRVINVTNVPAKGYIDAPKNDSTIYGEVDVRGWFLDASGVSKIEILLDGQIMGEAQYGLPRKDVSSAYPEYQNENSGYLYTLNTENLSNGKHTLVVRETGKNGVKTDLSSRVVNVQNLPAKGSIDSPVNRTSVKGETLVRGWYLDISGVSKIEVLVDGKYIGLAKYGTERPDVLKAYPGYQNGYSGYEFTLDTLQFNDGEHSLTVREVSKNGSIHTTNNSFYVYNGNPYLQIDLRKPANITASDIVNFFNRKSPDSPLKDYAQSFIDAQSKYGVNAQYLVAHAIWETGWGGSSLRNYKHNLYGYSAYDSCPFTCGFYFPTGGDSINFEGYIVRRDYLNETGSYFNGPTLTGMNVRYATDQNWKNGIANLMQSIKPFESDAYYRTGILPGSSVAAPSFGRDIPVGQPYPTNIIINYTVDTYATVTTNGLTFRSLPYVSASTEIKSLPSWKVVKVLGYNTDVKYAPGDMSQYPYDNRWYRVLVDGQEGWVYGGGIAFNK